MGLAKNVQINFFNNTTAEGDNDGAPGQDNIV